MILEGLVIYSCMNGDINTDKCEKSAQAYYHEMGLQYYADELSRRYRDYFVYLNAAKIASDKRVVVPVNKHIKIEISEDETKLLISIRF